MIIRVNGKEVDASGGLIIIANVPSEGVTIGSVKIIIRGGPLTIQSSGPKDECIHLHTDSVLTLNSGNESTLNSKRTG